MMIYLGMFVGYVLLGLVWARTQAVRLQLVINDSIERCSELSTKFGSHLYMSSWQKKTIKACRPWFARWTGTYRIASWLAIGLAFHALGWPLSALWRAWAWLLSWSASPVQKRRDEAAALRARADEGERLLHDSVLDASDRKILLSAWTDYRELAKKLEI